MNETIQIDQPIDDTIVTQLAILEKETAEMEAILKTGYAELQDVPTQTDALTDIKSRLKGCNARLGHIRNTLRILSN